MGKGKKNKQKYRLSKHDFVETICAKCGICVNGNPEMCFYGTYSINPKKFMASVYPKLMEHGDYFAAKGYEDVATECLDEDIISLLTEAFCGTNSCGISLKNGNCENMAMCLSSVRNQIRGAGRQLKMINKKIELPGSKWQKLSKKERKALECITVVVKKDIVPMFFCSENFEEEVDRILGNDNRESNTAEKST
jgi:hypothetical protein